MIVSKGSAWLGLKYNLNNLLRGNSEGRSQSVLLYTISNLKTLGTMNFGTEKEDMSSPALEVNGQGGDTIDGIRQTKVGAVPRTIASVFLN